MLSHFKVLLTKQLNALLDGRTVYYGAAGLIGVQNQKIKVPHRQGILLISGWIA